MPIIRRIKNGKKVGNLIVRYLDFDPVTGKRCQREKSVGSCDKALARALKSRCLAEARDHKAAAAKWAMLRREGLADTKSEQLARQSKKTLADHIEDFRMTMVAKERSAAHIANTISFCRQAFEACGFVYPADLDPVRLSAYITELKDRRPVPQRESRVWGEKAVKARKGLSHRAVNGRITAMKAFATWLVRHERIRTNPLQLLQKLNAKIDPRHQRRALTDKELAALFQAANKGDTAFGIDGPDRATLYRLAVGSGLRDSEIASLTPTSFDLRDLGAATVTIEPAYSKHRERDVQPIARDLATEMKAYIDGRSLNRPLWSMPWRTADMIRHDLAFARAAWLDQAPTPADREAPESESFCLYRDASDRVADFHALRHTFVTRLARAGVVPATAMRLARHKSIALTLEFYTHMLVSDAHAALDALPTITQAEKSSEQASGA